MIAQNAAELIIIAERKNLVARLHGKIPFEIAIFGWKRTVAQLEKLGRANIVLRDGRPAKTESNNYLAEVLVDRIYSLEDLEFQAKEIPGVLETGLFIGFVPGFPGAHSQGETLDEVNDNLHEVIAMLLEDGEPVLESEFVGVQNVAVA